jgi:hypothetical protein
LDNRAKSGDRSPFVKAAVGWIVVAYTRAGDQQAAGEWEKVRQDIGASAIDPSHESLQAITEH